MIGNCGDRSKAGIKAALQGWSRLTARTKHKRLEEIRTLWVARAQPWQIVIINKSNTYGLISIQPTNLAGAWEYQALKGQGVIQDALLPDLVAPPGEDRYGSSD
jgi:hypothetical protein